MKLVLSYKLLYNDYNTYVKYCQYNINNEHSFLNNEHSFFAIVLTLDTCGDILNP